MALNFLKGLANLFSLDFDALYQGEAVLENKLITSAEADGKINQLPLVDPDFFENAEVSEDVFQLRPKFAPISLSSQLPGTGGQIAEYLTAQLATFSSAYEFRTGGVINYDINAIYGTPETPITGNITEGEGSVVTGTMGIIVHKQATEPSLPENWVVRPDSQTYSATLWNFIYYQRLFTNVVSYKIEVMDLTSVVTPPEEIFGAFIHLKFESKDSNQFADNSGNGYNATITNPSDAAIISGAVNDAVTMGATGGESNKAFAEIASNTHLENLGSEFTVAFWVNIRETSSRRFFNTYNSANSNRGIDISATGGVGVNRMQFQINAAEQPSAADYQLRSSASTEGYTRENEWDFWAFTCLHTSTDSTQMRIWRYRDGIDSGVVSRGNKTIPVRLAVGNTNTLLINTNRDKTATRHTSYDDMYVIGTALTESQLNELVSKNTL
jgi:hypothetical protein